MRLKPLLLTLPLLACASLPATAWSAQTLRESLTATGTEANGDSGTVASGVDARSVLSLDGRYLAFASLASNLVPDDTNNLVDVFVRDRWTGEVSRVSVASDGTQANYHCDQPAISADGRYVTFASGASNLVPGDTNFQMDIFVHDRQTGETSRVSVASNGTQANFLATRPAISGDGRYVVFESLASTLVPDDTNGAVDVFMHDRLTGETRRVSVASDGTPGDGGSGYADISIDGRYVVFASDARNLVDGDGNARKDIFVHDGKTGTTSRVTVGYDGSESNNNSITPAISGNGRYVAFSSDAYNLVAGDINGVSDIFVFDRQTGVTTLESRQENGQQADGAVFHPVISADGRYVAFHSAFSLVADDTNSRYDVYLRDRAQATTTRASVAGDGSQGDDHSQYAALSGDGRLIAFTSAATNLVAGDGNAADDVFIRDQWAQPGKRADLKLDLQALGTPVVKGEQFQYRATVTNNGPAAAGQVNLTLWNTGGDKLRLVSATPSQGNCGQTAVGLCRLGSLASGGSATVLLTYKALKAGRVTQRASVTAAPKDTNLKNNGKVVNLTVAKP